LSLTKEEGKNLEEGLGPGNVSVKEGGRTGSNRGKHYQTLFEAESA